MKLDVLGRQNSLEKTNFLLSNKKRPTKIMYKLTGNTDHVYNADNNYNILQSNGLGHEKVI